MRRTGFDDAAAVHHHEVTGALCGQAEVVGDQQDGRAEFVGERLEVVEDLALHRDVQCRGRFVGDEQLGFTGEADGDERALLHTAGELVRILRGALLGIA